MKETALLIEAVASLLWPLLVLVLLLLLAPQIREVVVSARKRGFTLKVGGQELTMEEVREQQSALIQDLQVKVGDLEQALARLYAGEGSPAEAVPGLIPDLVPDLDLAAEPAPRSSPARVLWVDDQPKNNSYYVEQLHSGGVEVDLARSTSEALRRLERRDYRVVISDIGRREGDGYQNRAGLELLEALAKVRPGLPLAFFTSSAGVVHRREEAERLGAELITSSGTDLVRFLRVALPEWSP